MDFAFSPEDKAFREEVRDWLATNAPRERRPRGGKPMREFDLDWQRRKHAGGWSGLSWPKPVGGQGLSLIRQMIWYEEQARAEAPGLGCLSIALNHAGPSVIARGTEAQKAFHLPKILAGEVVWCQGFSEPNAGSDLANLRLAGRIEGDHIVVRGQKLWTSHAQIADFQELLVRTDPSLGRHKGISWVICDMTSPGITVRPIDTLAGDQHFCEVFYDDVRIPLTSVVGAVNEGWRVAMMTLTNERGGTTLSHAAELGRVVEHLIALAHERTDANGRPLASNEAIATRLAEHRADAAALRALTYSLISADPQDAASGGYAAVTFLFYGELLQRVRITGLKVLGTASVELSGDAEPWTRSWLADRMMVIAGGSVQVRKNIIAEKNPRPPAELLMSIISLTPQPDDQAVIDAVAPYLRDQFALASLALAPRHVDTGFWPHVAELGWLTATLDEEHGGTNFDLVQDMLMNREYGRYLAPVTLLSTTLGIRLLTECGARVPHGLRNGAERIGFAAFIAGGAIGSVLDGEVHLVDADAQHFLLVDGRRAALFSRGAAGEIASVESLDPTVTLARATLRRAPATHLQGDSGALAARMRLLIAAQLTGLSLAASGVAAEYAKIRVQFGKPIGAFQAVAHLCVDSAVRARASDAQLALASVALRDAWPDAELQVAAAAQLAGSAAFLAGTNTIQVLGGMGYSAESGAHLYLKRGVLLRRLLPAAAEMDATLQRMPQEV